MRRAAIAAALLALFLCSCAPQARERTVFAMDTVSELRVYGGEALLDDAQEILEGLEKSLSVTDPDSEISALNAAGSARLSPTALELVEEALELCRITDGALDITVYPVVRAWGFTTGTYRIPGREELKELLARVDYTGVSVSSGTVSLPHGAMIDLGSVAKGLASDAIRDAWVEGGAKSGLINLGGNVYALGSKPDGSPWRVGVRDPFGESYLGVLEVRDAAVVTSGGYERYFEQDGQVYWHIIDPKTGYPADSGLSSVTVVGREGLLCDGLSTAVFVMGKNAAERLWRSRGDFDLVLVTGEGEVYITEGLEDCFTLSGTYAGKEVKVIRRG